MSTYWFHAQNGDDSSGDGSSVLPWQTLSKLRTLTGDDHVIYLVGDFTDQTAGTNGLIEVGGHNWTIIGVDTNDQSPIVGYSRGSALNLANCVVASGTCTITTASNHGLLSNSTVLIEGLTAAAIANGYWKITVTGSATFTFTLAGTVSEASAGTVTCEARSVASYYNDGKNGCTVRNLYFTRTLYGVRLMGTIAGHVAEDIDGYILGQYGFSFGGGTTGMVIRRGTITLPREDAINVSGTSNEAFIIEDVIGVRVGYNPDGETFSNLGGAGDFATTHPGSGNSNYGTVRRCAAFFCTQGFATFTNTSGQSYVYDNFFAEVSGSAVVQNGGGSMATWNNRCIAPVTANLDGTSVHSAFRFNPANGVGGTFEAYHNVVYSARGSISPVSAAYFAFSVAGDTGVSVVKNNRFVSNGTAPFIHIANKTAVNISTVTIDVGETTIVTAAPHGFSTGFRVVILSVGGTATAANGTWTVTVSDTTTFTIALTGSGSSSGSGTAAKVPNLTLDNNGYSHTGSLFSYAGTKTLTTMQAHGFEGAAVSGCSLRTVPPTVDAHFKIVKVSNGFADGADLSALSLDGLLKDATGRSRPAVAAALGAFQVQLSSGRALSPGYLQPTL